MTGIVHIVYNSAIAKIPVDCRDIAGGIGKVHQYRRTGTGTDKGTIDGKSCIHIFHLYSDFSGIPPFAKLIQILFFALSLPLFSRHYEMP